MNTAVGARQVVNTLAFYQRLTHTCLALAPPVQVANALAFYQRLTRTCLAPFVQVTSAFAFHQPHPRLPHWN